MCEVYYSLHHSRALHRLQKRWATPFKGPYDNLTWDYGAILNAEQPLDRVAEYFGEVGHFTPMELHVPTNRSRCAGSF